MTKEQIELVIHLLNDLDERYENDGCNDLTKEEKALIKPLEKDIKKSLGLTESYCFNNDLVQYVIKLLRKELK